MTEIKHFQQVEAVTIDTILAIPNQKTLTRIVWISAFTILTAIGAQISVPTYPVPITLQTFFVILSGAFLGARKGALSQIAYLCTGAIGLPVFANGSGSILHLFGPTGGYLFGFPIAAFIVGYSLHDVSFIKKVPRIIISFAAMGVGLLAIFTLGIIQLYIIIFHNWSAAIQTGFVALQWWDGLKLIAAASIYSAVARRYSKVPE